MRKEWKICILGHAQTPGVHTGMQSWAKYIPIFGKAKPIHAQITSCFITSPVLVPSSCVHWHFRMFLQSRYFLVRNKIQVKLIHYRISKKWPCYYMCKYQFTIIQSVSHVSQKCVSKGKIPRSSALSNWLGGVLRMCLLSLQMSALYIHTAMKLWLQTVTKKPYVNGVTLRG